ncbi:MAG: FHA domain-containing protein [Candidatus Bruticola sp.]
MNPSVSEGLLYFLKFPLLGLICAFIGCSLWIIYRGLPDERQGHFSRGPKEDTSSEGARSLSSDSAGSLVPQERTRTENYAKSKVHKSASLNSSAVGAERFVTETAEAPAFDMHNALTDTELPAVGGRHLEVAAGSCLDVKFLPLKSNLIFGRSKECNVRLEDAFVSGRHAQILLESDGDVLLEDLNSSNGTFCNGTLLTVPVYLKDGDTFSIGNSTFCYKQS